MSFLKSLFGGAKVAEATVTAREEYKGFSISAEPYAADGQFQVAGTIIKVVDGVEQIHAFVRADRFAARDDATQIAFLKGRQLIDQLGERLFG